MLKKRVNNTHSEEIESSKNPKNSLKYTNKTSKFNKKSKKFKIKLKKLIKI